jgi:hypothetical protein
MAMTSGIYGSLLRDTLSNSFAYDLATGGDSIKWQTTTDTLSPDYDAAAPVEADLTAEVTGAGYSTGGEVLAGQDVTIAAGVLKFDGTDVSLSTTTLASVEGVVLLDDTLATPVKPLICAIDFTTPYSTSSGTFAIVWDAAGIFTIDYTP